MTKWARKSLFFFIMIMCASMLYAQNQVVAVPPPPPGGGGWGGSIGSQWLSQGSLTVAITELRLGSGNYVEIQNVSNAPIDLTDWYLLTSDDPQDLGTPNKTAAFLSGVLQPGEVLIRNEDPGSSDYWGADLNWEFSETGLAWVALFDDSLNPVDVVFVNASASDISNHYIPSFVESSTGNLTTVGTLGNEWDGAGIQIDTGLPPIKDKGSQDSTLSGPFTTSNSMRTISRIGEWDSNRAEDWNQKSSSPGTTNPDITLPFGKVPEPLGLSGTFVIATVGLDFSHTLQATGGSGQYEYSFDTGPYYNPLSTSYYDVPPKWLQLDSTTGELSGKPEVADVGYFYISIRVSDSNMNISTSYISLEVHYAGGLDLPKVSLLATQGVAFSASIQATGGNGNYTYSSTNLPAWLTLDSATGELNGTPGIADIKTSTFDLVVSDGVEGQSEQVTIEVQYPGGLGLPQLQGLAAILGQEFSLQIQADGGSGSYTYSSLDLPSWLALDGNTGVLVGTPGADELGVHDFTLKVEDGVMDFSQVYSIEVKTIQTIEGKSVLSGTAAEKNSSGGGCAFGADTSKQGISLLFGLLGMMVFFFRRRRQLNA